MADNVAITAGSGTSVATDDVAGVQYQRVKLADGTADSATVIAAGGGTEDEALRVTIASDSTGVISIDDNGAAITVDGTITAELSAVDNAVLDAIEADTTTIAGAIDGTEMQVDVLTMPTTTVQATNLDIRDIDKASDDILVYANTVKDGSGTSYVPLVDADGHLQVDILSGSTTGTEYTEAQEDATPTGNAIVFFDGSNLANVVNSNNPFPVEVTNSLILEVGDNNIGNVDIVSVPAPLSTTGGGTEADALRVTIASDSTGVLSVDDNGSALTVDNGGTFAVQVDGAALTSLQLIDDAIYTDGTGTPSKAIAVAGTDGTNPQIIKTDASGELQVDVLSSALPTGASTAANQTTIIGHVDGIETLLGTIDADTSTLAGAVSGTEMQVDVLSSALPTGASTSAKQDTVIGHLDGVETLLGTIDADTSGLFGTVSGSELQVDIVSPGSGTYITKEVRSATPTQSTVAGSASSVSLLASNANRLGATISNDSTAVLYVKLGTTASTTSYTIKLSTDDYYEIPYGYTGAIDGIWASATGNARITELAT